MSDLIAVATSVIPIVGSAFGALGTAVGVVKDARNFIIEIESKEKEQNKINKLWGSLNFKVE
jgi:hypothetical protein